VNAPELQEAIHHLAVSATTALGSLTKAATEIQQLAQQTQQLAQQTQQLVQQVDKQLEQVASNVATTIEQVRRLTQTVHTQALSLTTDFRETATSALNAMELLRATLRPSNSSPPEP
jgi:methyl-accepting chemotaxis protein